MSISSLSAGLPHLFAAQTRAAALAPDKPNDNDGDDVGAAAPPPATPASGRGSNVNLVA